MVTLRDGLDRKDVRKVTPQWYRQAIQKCFTQDEIERLLKQLEPKDKLDILLKTLPKEIVNDNKGLQIVVRVMGINPKPIIQAREIIGNELPEHESD